MKRVLYTAFVLMASAVFVSGCNSTKAVAQSPSNSVSISYQDFYDGLSPYGTWIDYPGYGHVWHPSITGEFRPYLTNGYWDYSTEGWMWQSNYRWGWAPFHYGRWVYDNIYGWLWVPGYEWSPAWVTWGSVDRFYCWAPLMPEVNVGVAFGLWRPSAFYWNVVGREHIYDREVFNLVERREVVNNYVNRVNIINNFNHTSIHNQFYARGPEVKEVERFTSRTITPASIREVDKIGSPRREGNEIQVYRPSITHPQPREFRRLEEPSQNPVRSSEERTTNSEIEQKRNLERLPVHRAPENAFRRIEQYNRGGGRRR